jgi:hypothetical protein
MLTFGLLLAVALQTQTVRPHVSPNERHCSGTVFDENNAPLAGARIEWRHREANGSTRLGETTSHADGTFELRVDPRLDRTWKPDTYLTLEFPGLAPTRIEQLPYRVDQLELGSIHVYPFAELHGRVVDADGKPIREARIHAAQGRALGASLDTYGLPPVATTDADGRFACRNVPSGLVTLGVSANGFADLVFEPRSLALRSANELSAVLQPARAVTLRVHDAGTGKPLLATCTPLGSFARNVEGIDDGGEARLAFWRTPLVGDLSGRITIDALPTPFEGGVLVEAEGRAPQFVSLGAGDSVVSLSETTRVDVRARREGSSGPVEMLAVHLRDGTAPSSGCGNCEDFNWLKLSDESPAVQRVARDHWRIEWNGLGARVRGGQPSRVFALLVDGGTQVAELELEPEAREAEIVLEFEPLARLAGRIVSPEGKGLPLGLRFQRTLEGHLFRFDADAEGRFDVLLGDGACWLAPVERTWSLPFGEQRVELAPATTREVELVVKPAEPLDLRVRGTVTIGGARAKRQLMLALYDEPRETIAATTWTDEAGRFEFLAPYRDSFWILQKVQEPLGSSWRELGREFRDRSSGSGRPVDVDGAPLDALTIDLP